MNLLINFSSQTLTFDSHTEANGTTLTITESTAYLDKVAFLSTLETALYHADTSIQPEAIVLLIRPLLTKSWQIEVLSSSHKTYLLWE